MMSAGLSSQSEDTKLINEIRSLISFIGRATSIIEDRCVRAFGNTTNFCAFIKDSLGDLSVSRIHRSDERHAGYSSTTHKLSYSSDYCRSLYGIELEINSSQSCRVFVDGSLFCVPEQGFPSDRNEMSEAIRALLPSLNAIRLIFETCQLEISPNVNADWTALRAPESSGFARQVEVLKDQF